MQRRRYPASLACPEPFFQRSREQPNLLSWICYSPPFNFDIHRLTMVVPWDHIVSITQQAVRGILQSHEAITDNFAREHIPRWASASLAWLASEPVKTWYHQLRDGPRKSYRSLLAHIANECRRISEKDGCFISLNYAVRSIKVLVPPSPVPELILLLVQTDTAAA